ncbi:MAG: branched-chain amino acid transport system ATP-binding protein [Acidimicrobiaceae bacterium]|nr:branched-chain amino acid transport system ATP-binding protein [Acidimicrobiaceae bacterium]
MNLEDQPPLLELREVHKHFGGVNAVDGVSFAVRRGAVSGLIGPNGAGKTTVVNLVTGQLSPDDGAILLDGAAIGGLKPHQVAARGVARTFQNIRLYRPLSVLENVLTGMHRHRRADGWSHLLPSRRPRPPDQARQDEAFRLLTQVGLDPAKVAQRQSGTLSYGDQRRLEIARALALRPELLLLDEPAAGLNPGEKAQLGDLLGRLQAEGLTVLLIDHDMKLVLSVCDDVTVLNFGRRIASGPPAVVAADDAVVTAYLGTGAGAGARVEPLRVAGATATLPRLDPGSPTPVVAPGAIPLELGAHAGVAPADSALPNAAASDAAAADAVLVVEHLAVFYGAVEAVADVSLSVASGEIVALIGANGAGKSTVLNTLSGLLRPRRGTAVFGSLDLARARPQAIVRAGLVQVPEGREILSRLTVEENLLLGGWTRPDRASVGASVEEMMERFPILRERRRLAAGQLSGGEQQQLAIARALISAPRLLLLDEPSLGLAPQLAEQVFSLIAAIRETGITVLLVEQNARRALELADRAYVIETGRVVLTGTGDELRDHPLVRQAYLGTS